MTTTDATITDAHETPTEQLMRPEVQARLVPATATQVSVQARQHGFTIDEPGSLGGTDLGPNPVDALLAALGACQVITFQVWAEELGLTFDALDIDLARRTRLPWILRLHRGGSARFQEHRHRGAVARCRDCRTVCPTRRNRRAALPRPGQSIHPGARPRDIHSSHRYGTLTARPVHGATTHAQCRSARLNRMRLPGTTLHDRGESSRVA